MSIFQAAFSHLLCQLVPGYLHTRKFPRCIQGALGGPECLHRTHSFMRWWTMQVADMFCWNSHQKCRLMRDVLESLIVDFVYFFLLKLLSRSKLYCPTNPCRHDEACLWIMNHETSFGLELYYAQNLFFFPTRYYLSKSLQPFDNICVLPLLFTKNMISICESCQSNQIAAWFGRCVQSLWISKIGLTCSGAVCWKVNRLTAKKCQYVASNPGRL